MDNDRESPTSSPAPGALTGREYDDELSMGGEAEAYATPGHSEELNLAGPSYRYLDDRSPAVPSPAPSHSGIDTDYDLINDQQESSISFSRQFDVLSGSSASSSAPCTSSSSSAYVLTCSNQITSFQSLPVTARSRIPGSSDPVFSAHSQPIQNDLLPFSSHALSSQQGQPSEWQRQNDLPISSSWVSNDSGSGPSDWDRAQLRAGPSDWSRAVPSDWESGVSLPGPSGLEQAVPEQLTLEGDDQDSRDLQWTASSSGIERHLDYSEENSLESEVQQSFSQYANSIEASGFSPQPSSSVSTVTGSLFINRVSPLDPNLSSVARYSPNFHAPLNNSAESTQENISGSNGEKSKSSVVPNGPGPSVQNKNQNNDHLPDTEGISGAQRLLPENDEISVTPGTAPKVASAKRSINFPDSPTAPDNIKRPRRHLDEVRPDSPAQEASRAGQRSPRSHEQIDLYFEARPQVSGTSVNNQYGFDANDRRFPSFNGQSSSRTTRRHVRTLNANIEEESENHLLLPNLPPRHMSRSESQVREMISIDIPTESPNVGASSMSSQLTREIENCLKDERNERRNNDRFRIEGAGPSRQPPRVSFGRHNQVQNPPPPRATFGRFVPMNSFGNSSRNRVEQNAVENAVQSNSYQRFARIPESNLQGASNQIDQSDSIRSSEAPGVQSAMLPNPNSPTGSEVNEAGPSRAIMQDIHRNVNNDNSPSGSDAEAAGPSQPMIVHENNPNSPAPSESEMDEAGPSNRAYHGWPQPYHGGEVELEREAAPARREPSPVRQPPRNRRYIQDHCMISSSTGPVDSNPPTPEMFDVSGDIDNDLSFPSPPMQHMNQAMHNDENVVDSTVDSTSNIPFINSPEYMGNEAQHDGESSDGEDDNDNESVAGSEASSTTSARFDEQGLSLPGQDDTEGISTSGQVDSGQFRLVPNDMDVSTERRTVRGPADSPQYVPDVQEILMDEEQSDTEVDPSVASLETENNDSVPVFKKPYNRKGRLIDNFSYQDQQNNGEPVAGPSGYSRNVNPTHGSASPSNENSESEISLPSTSNSSITMSLLTSNKSSSRSGSNMPTSSSISLFPVYSDPTRSNMLGQSNASSSGTSSSKRNNSHLMIASNEQNPLLFNTQNEYPNNLGIGLAFSALPGSVTLSKTNSNQNENQRETDQGSAQASGSGGDSISGPLSKRLRTRHFQDVAKANQEQIQPAENVINIEPKDDVGPDPAPNLVERRPISTGSEILRNSLEGKPRNHIQNENQETRASNQTGQFNQPVVYPANGNVVLVQDLIPNQQRNLLEQETNQQDQNPNRAEPLEVPVNEMNQESTSSNHNGSRSENPSASMDTNNQSNLFLGGTQQSYSLTLETNSVSLSALKPKKIFQTKSAAECNDFLPTGDQSWSQDELKDIQITMASEVIEDEKLDSILKQELENKQRKETSFQYISPKKRTTMEYAQSQTASSVAAPESKEQELAPLTISDKPVQSRAVASLPSNYLALRTDENNTQAVFAQKTIPVSCRFGPMEGKLVDPTEETNLHFNLSLIAQGQRLDVSSEEDSNWMRFIHPASTESDQNLTLSEVNGQIYFTSTRLIGPDEELKVWYSDQYSTQHGLPKSPSEAPHKALVEDANGAKVPKKNVDKHKNSKFSVMSNVMRENIAEKTKKSPDSHNYMCEICNRKFERQASLSRHLALHKGDKNHTCKDCGQKFSHTFNLERHRKKVHHSDPAGQYVRCTNCATWFPSNMVLKVHMFSHHPNKEEQNWTVEDAMAQSGKEGSEQAAEEMKFQCPSEGCCCQYDTWLELVEHAGEHGMPHLPFNENGNAQSGPVHKCELCYKTFANDVRLKKHMAVHAGNDTKPLECTECGKRFLTNSALAGHIKTHAHPDALYDCPICLQEFEQVSSLKDHVYDHKENGVFTCPHCEKTFNEYPNIRKHIRAFHSEKRFACTLCEKSFTGKDKLKIHMVRYVNILIER